MITYDVISLKQIRKIFLLFETGINKTMSRNMSKTIRIISIKFF